MGICLDTDANTSRDEESGAEWKGGGRNRQNSISSRLRTPHDGLGGVPVRLQNTSKIKFDPPKVPVIFILGGPGSGKVTHCDTLMQEKKGVTHINMMDLLQQYAMGNDMQDFSQLPSKTVTEVLMLEIKMAPAAKAYLISGYPRSMRDVVEYSEKIQVVNGVILISWRQSVLQKQIDYGAKLGHVVLSLAKMELENFFKNVMPVADYFDQSDMLVAVNGERAPAEVYKDFRAAALDILSALENQEAILNGISGMGKGINDIPGSIVSVDTAPSQEKNLTELTNQQSSQLLQHRAQIATIANETANMMMTTNNQLPNQYIDNNMHNNEDNSNIGTSRNHQQHFMNNNDTSGSLMGPQSTMTTHFHNNLPNNKYGEIPPCIWVIGGPGSNKATLCLKAVGLNPGWAHLSFGRLLRQITDSAPRANTESYAIKEALAAGEMAPEKAITFLLETNLRQLGDKNGVLIDGFPRNLHQANLFEETYKQRPPIILLDCSKLQLGRGRIDDTVSSFRRRLELFREQTLPMLKIMDTNNRLIIVDGDTDSPSVQREFEKIIRSHIQRLTGTAAGGGGNATSNTSTIHNQVMSLMNMSTMNSLGNQNETTIIQDLDENVPGVVPTISHHVSLANGHLRNNHNNTNQIQTNINNSTGTGAGNNRVLNGHIPNGAMHFMQVLQETDRASNQPNNYI